MTTAVCLDSDKSTIDTLRLDFRERVFTDEVVVLIEIDSGAKPQDASPLANAQPPMRRVDRGIGPDWNMDFLRGGGRAVGLTGSDGAMLRAQQRDPVLGRVGEIISVDPHAIHQAFARSVQNSSSPTPREPIAAEVVSQATAALQSVSPAV